MSWRRRSDDGFHRSQRSRRATYIRRRHDMRWPTSRWSSRRPGRTQEATAQQYIEALEECCHIAAEPSGLSRRLSRSCFCMSWRRFRRLLFFLFPFFLYGAGCVNAPLGSTQKEEMLYLSWPDYCIYNRMQKNRISLHGECMVCMRAFQFLHDE